MKGIWIGIVLLLLTGCGAAEQTQAQAGRIGEDAPISREMAAKTIALAFYTPQELAGTAWETAFPDVAETDWAYPYIGGCVAQGFFAGGEEGDFRPQDALTLWEAQALMDRLAPDYNSRIVLTAENKNLPVSYDLWVQLLQTALTARRGEDSLYSYGLRTENAVLLTAEGLCDTGQFAAAGLDLEQYVGCRVTFLAKEGEIAALLTVEAAAPLVRNLYCTKVGSALRLDTGAGTVDLAYDGAFEAGIADVKLENGRIAAVSPAEEAGRCTVRRVDAAEISLAEKGVLEWTADARVYDGRGETLTQAEKTALLCGTDCAAYYLRDGAVCAAVIQADATAETIRVLLKGGAQERVGISAEGGFTMTNAAAEKAFAAGESADLTADLPWFAHGVLTVRADAPIRLSFADGTAYAYEGTLELERRGADGFTIVNELPTERYLTGVVPHEMPVSFGQAALQAQAIAARGYAYHAFYANAYASEGAHLTDSVASQVYLGYAPNEAAEEAVSATAGQCVVLGDRVAQTYFYSTSGGFGAAAEEVWSADGSFGGAGKPYLRAQAYGDYTAPETEADWLAFWQAADETGTDRESPWYRWKVYFSCGQLSEILAETLAKCAVEKPQVVQLQQSDGTFQAGEIGDTGRLEGVSVTRRGAGGVVMEIELRFANETVRLRTENAICRAFSPTKRTQGETIYLQKSDGQSLTGAEMLPSGFFAVREMRNEAGDLTGIALYGGGNGHGVGMSQYGAKQLAAEGKTAAEILAYYFPETTVAEVY